MHTINCEYCGEPLEGLVVGLLHKHCRDALNKELYELVETNEAEGFEMVDNSNFSSEEILEEDPVAERMRRMYDYFNDSPSSP